MKHSIGIPLALFGLLTVAMIYTTSAQTADNSPGTVPRQRRPDLILDPSNPPPTRPGGIAPPAVGRYQAVSHNGRLLLIDTATAECWSLSGSGWVQRAQPINRANAASAADSGNRAPANKIVDGPDGEPVARGRPIKEITAGSDGDVASPRCTASGVSFGKRKSRLERI